MLYIWTNFKNLYKLEFQESDVSPGKTDVKEGKFVEFISPVKFFRETYKSQNINPISQTPKFTLGILQIKVKSLMLTGMILFRKSLI